MAKDSVAFHPTNEGIVDFMVKTISGSKTASVLDTGYGEGAFLDGLIKSGFDDIAGIELSKEFYQATKDLYPDVKLVCENYLTYNENYDTIIGNPPYMKCSKLDEDTQNVLLNLTKTKSSDIYYGFIIKSIMNLHVGGELIYILPSTFFTNTYGKHLRDFMVDNGSFEYIINLGELPVFQTANVETIIFKYKKKVYHSKTDVYNVKKKREKDYIRLMNDVYDNKVENDLFTYHQISPFEKGTTWNTSENVYNFKYENLSDYLNIGVGIVSGCDAVFAIKDDHAFTTKEKDVFVRKFLKGKNLKPYISSGELTKMIFINSSFDHVTKLKPYPNILKHVKKHKDILEDRYFSSSKKPYFYWLAIRNLNEIESNKNRNVISVPCMTRKKGQWFSVSKDKDRYISSDVLYLSPKKDDDLYFILGLLNSDFFADYYNSIGIKKGERFVFSQKFLTEIKIPEIGDNDRKSISGLTKDIINNIESNKDIDDLRDSIDSIINRNLTHV